MENDKWLKMDIVKENEQLKKDKENLTNIIKKQDEEDKKKYFKNELKKGMEIKQMTVRELTELARFETIIIKGIMSGKVYNKNSKDIALYLDKKITTISTQFSIPENTNMVKTEIVAFIDDEENI